jgi:hypothetical protein
VLLLRLSFLVVCRSEDYIPQLVLLVWLSCEIAVEYYNTVAAACKAEVDVAIVVFSRSVAVIVIFMKKKNLLMNVTIAVALP